MKKIKRILFFVILCLIAVYSTGCATITRGTTEAFILETEPAGATASLSTGEKCTTPCNILKKHKDEFSVHLEKDGYEPVDMQIKSQIVGAGAAGFAGNVLVGGLIGAGVDAVSGATKGLVPNPAQVTLAPLGEAKNVTTSVAGGEAENVTDVTETKICPYCGVPLEMKAVFCMFCQKDLKENDGPIKEIQRIDNDVGKAKSI